MALRQNEQHKENKKYYAVFIGTNPGIYHDVWINVLPLVKGYPKARYKGFKVEEEAKTWWLSQIQETSVAVTPSSGVIISQSADIPTIIYTDGSSIDKEGGWGIVMIKDDQVYQYKGKCPYDPCTNNQAELFAILTALTNFRENLELRTDSQYSMKSITIWSKKWQRNGWKTSTGKDVENKELIQAILPLLDERIVKFTHVYAHRGEQYNEMADRLADEGRMM